MKRTFSGFRAATLALGLGTLMTMGASLAGCMRDDPAPAAVDSQSRQQLDILHRQLEALSNELRTNNTNTSDGGGDVSELIARLAVLEDRAVRDADFLALKNEVEKLQEAKAGLEREFAEARNELQRLSELERDHERLAVSLQDTSGAQRSVAERVDSQAERLRELEATVLARISDYLEALESGPQDTDPRLHRRIEQLEDELETVLAENERLNEELAENERELSRSNSTIDRLVQRVERLQEQLEEEGLEPTTRRPGTGAEDEEDAEEEAEIPEAVRDGAYTGRVRLVRENEGILSCIVSFPVGTPRTVDMRFNVFNQDGRKIANFVVTYDATLDDLEGEEVWLGGRLEPLQGRRLPQRNDRVSNLDSLPETTRDTDSDGLPIDEDDLDGSD